MENEEQELTVEELQAIADMEAQQAEEAQAILDAKIASEKEAVEAAVLEEEKSLRLVALRARLKAVSQNNVAYVEAFGHDIHWSKHHAECLSCECDVTLELLVSELEQALAKVNQEEAQKQVSAQAAKASLKVKLEALGITEEELKSLIN